MDGTLGAEGSYSFHVATDIWIGRGAHEQSIVCQSTDCAHHSECWDRAVHVSTRCRSGQGDQKCHADFAPERAAPLLHADVVLSRWAGSLKSAQTLFSGPHVQWTDGGRGFWSPGLIDSHVHVGHSAALDDDAIEAHPELRAAYRAQVPSPISHSASRQSLISTSCQATGLGLNARRCIPRFYSCGAGVKVAGGYMAFDVPPLSVAERSNLVYEPKESEHWPKSLDPGEYTAQRTVSRAADAGGICVKAFVEPGFGMFNWPYLHTATLQKIQAAARERKLVLMVHATSVDSWQSALDAHAAIIAHGLWVWPGDFVNPVPPPAASSVIAAAARAGAHVQPTLQTVAGERAMIDPSLLDDPRLTMALPPAVIAYLRSPAGMKARTALLDEYRKASPPPGFEVLLKATIERTRGTFKDMLQEQVALIFGSDTPGVDGFGNPPGLNGRFELQNWADAGAPLSLILRAATLDNATVLGLSHDIGSIEVGKRADLLLLKDNPLVNVSAYDSIETIFLNGEPIAREALRAHN